MRAMLKTIVVLGLAVGLTQTGLAQSRSAFGGTSSLGGTIGSSGGSSMFGGSSGLGGGMGSFGSGMGGSGGMGGFGSGMGGSGGMGSFGSSMGGFGSSGGYGSGNIMNPFMSNSQQGAFVGTSAQSAQALARQLTNSQAGANSSSGMSGYGAGGMGGYGVGNRANGLGLNGMRSGQMMGGQMSGQGMGTAGAARTTVAVRTLLHPAFDHPKVAIADTVAVLSKRLEKIPAITAQKLDVSVQGQTVVLRGEVATEHGRLLAEQLVRLEPGVSAVRNELTVAPPSAPPKTDDGQPKPLPVTPSVERRMPSQGE